MNTADGNSLVPTLPTMQLQHWQFGRGLCVCYIALDRDEEQAASPSGAIKGFIQGGWPTLFDYKRTKHGKWEGAEGHLLCTTPSPPPRHCNLATLLPWNLKNVKMKVICDTLGLNVTLYSPPPSETGPGAGEQSFRRAGNLVQCEHLNLSDRKAGAAASHSHCYNNHGAVGATRWLGSSDATVQCHLPASSPEPSSPRRVFTLTETRPVRRRRRWGRVCVYSQWSEEWGSSDPLRQTD